MYKVFAILLLLVSANVAHAQTADRPKPTLLPSAFINGERFYIKMAVAPGDTLLGYGDTGGGFTAIFPPSIEKYKLAAKVKEVKVGSATYQYMLFRDLVTDNRIPLVASIPMSPLKESFFMIPEEKFMQGEGKSLLTTMPQDVFLGQFFFFGKAWTFDYKKQEVWVNTPIARDSKRPGVQSVGFKKDDAGKKMYGHPSMVIEVDGEKIDVLFDTGAMFILSDDAKGKLNQQEKTMGGSFIARSIFDKWHVSHPHWKIIEMADNGTDIIEVPKIKIGNLEVGPVLFSKRNDEVWSKSMIATMDKVVKGAIGGSAFKFLKVKIDYNSEMAEFTAK